MEGSRGSSTASNQKYIKMQGYSMDYNLWDWAACLEPAHPAAVMLDLWEAVGNWEDCVWGRWWPVARSDPYMCIVWTTEFLFSIFFKLKNLASTERFKVISHKKQIFCQGLRHSLLSPHHWGVTSFRCVSTVSPCSLQLFSLSVSLQRHWIFDP